MGRAGKLLAIGVLALLAARNCGATEIVAGGLSFSDEGGGFRLLAVSGSGSAADPFVVVEEITGPGAAVLVVRGLDRLAGMQGGFGAVRVVAVHLRKIAINRTRQPWHQFEAELRETPRRPSDYYDGLSFDQLRLLPRPFRADRFRDTAEIAEPYDALRFSRGVVEPGDAVTMDIAVTDTSPTPVFHLVQRPAEVVAWEARRRLPAT